MRVYRTCAILIACGILCVSAVYAGSTHRLTCNDQQCRFQQDVDFGGGFTFMLITGYCLGCEHFVNISWRHSERPIEPLGEVWDEKSGERRPIYPCPKCGKPFLPIARPDQIKHCPKCGKSTLKDQMMLLYD
jgi:hypothetical protein